MKVASMIAAALGLAACGSNNSNLATDRNRAGSGSSILQVNASVNASMTSGGPVTDFRVDLADGLGNNVSGATVSISTRDLGEVALVEANVGSGRYVNSKTSFPTGDLVLKVTRGTDTIRDVVVGNPGAQTINGPARSAIVPANQPLQLSWTTPVIAKAVTIETRDYQADAADTGMYTIPAIGNPARTNQRLKISRVNEVEIAAALSGSRLSVTFLATVDPFTVQ
jgi:hypothetical protein